MRALRRRSGFLIVIAEMIGAKSGLGYMIWNAWQIFAVPTMYVGLITVSVLGVLFTLALTGARAGPDPVAAGALSPMKVRG